MKNVTISMDEKLAREVRVEAAKAGKSMSRFIAEVVELALHQPVTGGGGGKTQQEAIKAILAGPKWDVTEDGRMPTAEERNARR